MNDTFESVTSLRTRLDVLVAEHQDIDEAISRLDDHPSADELLVRRLKKRKLFVKDRISLIERMMSPDVLA
ncbi:YdcH family protein [Niveibacterium sp. SC-1]|uniref:YdcH family protein n=1 Tax=Niveibacterium sp. SC-1 TaxID=3135646 RepID=UPI00311D586C